MICTVLRVDTGLPFIDRAELIANDDGSVSFNVGAGRFAGQEPWIVGGTSTYGVRYPDSTTCGAYQRATLRGNQVIFLTRPQDVPCVYLIGLGAAY